MQQPTKHKMFIASKSSQRHLCGTLALIEEIKIRIDFKLNYTYFAFKKRK